MNRTRKIVAGLSIALFIGALSTEAGAVTVIDRTFTPDYEVIFGSGNADGSWTSDQSGGIELAMRAKVRFPVPANVFNSNADGTYTHLAGNDAGRPLWSFEWSVNTNWDGSSPGVKLDDFTYKIGIDFDPGAGTTFFEFDPITPGAVPFWDHSIGTNATANGGGTEAGDAPTYVSLLAANNLAQNSWRMDFFDAPTSPFAFNPNTPGTYSFTLTAFNSELSTVASTGIDVNVVTPEPSTFILFGMGLVGLVAYSRRRRG